MYYIVASLYDDDNDNDVVILVYFDTSQCMAYDCMRASKNVCCICAYALSEIHSVNDSNVCGEFDFNRFLGNSEQILVRYGSVR